METAKIAEPISGDKLYQQRARAAFPLLVRQALSGTSVVYEDLAEELGMPNPRNLNYVLGSIGNAIKNLAKEWDEEIPPIQCLVISKTTEFPGEGISWFISDKESYKKLPKKQKQQVIAAEQIKIFAYKYWLEVLAELNLQPIETDYRSLNQKASRRGGGEGKDHKALKEYIAKHPELVGLKNDVAHGDIEHRLPSGDSIDVLFLEGTEQIGIEVKPPLSDDVDIARGLYQCVKYKAILEARQSVELLPQNSKAILVLGGSLPQSLIGLRNILGVPVSTYAKVIRCSLP